MNEEAGIEEAINDLTKESEVLLAEADNEGVVVPSRLFADFNYFLKQSQTALDQENFDEAKKFINEARNKLHQIKNTLADLEASQ